MEELAGVNEGGGINFVIPQMTPVTFLRPLIAANCTVNAPTRRGLWKESRGCVGCGVGLQSK